MPQTPKLVSGKIDYTVLVFSLSNRTVYRNQNKNYERVKRGSVVRSVTIITQHLCFKASPLFCITPFCFPLFGFTLLHPFCFTHPSVCPFLQHRPLLLPPLLLPLFLLYPLLLLPLLLPQNTIRVIVETRYEGLPIKLTKVDVSRQAQTHSGRDFKADERLEQNSVTLHV